MVINNDAFQMIDLVDHIERRIDSHNAYGSRHCIGNFCVGTKNSNTFHARNRHSCFGINGMRIFFTVDHDEFFLIPGSCNRHIGDIHVGKWLFGIIGIGNSDSPGFSVCLISPSC